MKKVVIEINPEGWKTTVWAEGQKYVQRWKRTDSGCESLDSLDEHDLPPDLVDALEDSCLMDIMYALDAFEDE